MTLDPTAAAALAQGCFQVLLPPPQPAHKVFVLLQSHYLSSLGRCWKPGDRVQVCGLITCQMTHLQSSVELKVWLHPTC